MSWLFGGGGATGQAAAGNAQFDELLTKCTSELLPTPSTEEGALDSEFEVALQLSDMIRSGQVKASDAVLGFRRKLANSNPNVQLRALITLDTAIKNSGDAFLKEVAGASSASQNAVGFIAGTEKLDLREQLEDLVRASFNHEVRNLATRLVQTWATAFQSKRNLSISNMVLLYTRLKNSGCTFPPVSTSATSAMIDSLSAPSWSANEDSDRCERCRDPFTLTNRRHHCRNCGLLFDQKCSSNQIPLPHFGITQPVRVCDGCHKKIASGAPPIPRPEPPTKLQPRDATYHSSSREDEDLQLALRLSLESAPVSERPGAAQSSTSGYNPSYDTPAQRGRQVTTDVVAEEEDEDLKRAIEASLKDMELASANPYTSQAAAASGSHPAHAPQRSQSQSSSSYLPPLPNTDLTDGELTSLLSFAQSVLSPNPSAPPTVHDLQPTYERAEASRTSLVKNLRETVGRETALAETRDKMREIMRLYEARLDRQLQRSTAPQYSHYAPPPTHQPYAAPQQQPPPPQHYAQSPQPSMYPSMYQQPSQPQQFVPPAMYPQLHQHANSYAAPSQYQTQQHSQAVASAAPPHHEASAGAMSQPYQPQKWTQQAHHEQTVQSAMGPSPQVHQEDRPVYTEAQQEHPSAPSAPELEPSAPHMLSISSPPAASAPLRSPSLQSPESAEPMQPYEHQPQQQSAFPQGTVAPAPPQEAQPGPPQTHQASGYSIHHDPNATAYQSQQTPAPFNKLATLPGAPQDRPFAPQEFPSVPLSDFTAQMSMPQQQHQERKELAPLIDL